jgi:thiamine biosynthesis protein ThiS
LSDAQQVFGGNWKFRRGPLANKSPKAARYMQLTINGKQTTAATGSTIQNLLDQLRLDSRQVVVERNRDIVPRQRFVEEFLADGDSLEIVQFVGGG